MSPWSLFLRLVGKMLKSLAPLTLREPAFAFFTVVDADWRTGAGTAVLPVLLDLHVKGTE